ncbi:nucleotide exchange factor GrpE [Mogibacterium diversum]|uniref:nucleotide exchange factor GrpE n=1 Tax=Mogibacterium diversum TaxID=114527 RepID=UPI0028D07EDE|nr:nucleotide exchange factor GrpE [Mogibacterium diversum]
MTEEKKINGDQAEAQTKATEELKTETSDSIDNNMENETTSKEGEQPESSESSEDNASEVATEDNNKKAEAEENGDAKYLRLMAEFQNYKKRVAKEKSDIHSYANEKIVTELLEVLDNFERALATDNSTDVEGYAQGMKLIFNQLLGVLTKSGLVEVKALGEEFDPNMHNAVMTADSEEYDSNKVCSVLQKGYTLNGKVIRPSMVTVAK